jgi:hypothetical protein
VQQAALFLQNIHKLYPGATITLTGHSLGGGIAQMLGAASGYRTVAFNAPGTQALYGNLTSELAPAVAVGADGSNSTNSSKGSNDNYRALGDQVSLSGAQIGKVFTVTSPGQNPVDIWQDHKMDTVLNGLQKGTVADGVSDSIIPVNYPLTALQNSPNITFSVHILAAGLNAYFDPAASADYRMTGDATSPLISGVTLPNYTGITSYQLSTLTNGN